MQEINSNLLNNQAIAASLHGDRHSYYQDHLEGHVN